MKKNMLKTLKTFILAIVIPFTAHAVEEHVLWWQTSNELDRYDYINLIVFKEDAVDQIISIDKSTGQSSWLNLSKAFATLIEMDMSDPVAYSFQFELLQGQLGWQHSNLYQYENISKYIRPNIPGWGTQYLNTGYFHLNPSTFQPGQITPEPNSLLLVLFGTGLLLLRRKLS